MDSKKYVVYVELGYDIDSVRIFGVYSTETLAKLAVEKANEYYEGDVAWIEKQEVEIML